MPPLDRRRTVRGGYIRRQCSVKDVRPDQWIDAPGYVSPFTPPRRTSLPSLVHDTSILVCVNQRRGPNEAFGTLKGLTTHTLLEDSNEDVSRKVGIHSHMIVPPRT